MKNFLLSSCLLVALVAATPLPARADFAAGLESYRHGDYGRALKEFKADGGPQAQFYLSMMYEKGEGTRQDREASLAYLRKAAEEGLDVAQAALGLLYLEGSGVQADEQEGLTWLRKAAAQGLPEAKAILKLSETMQTTMQVAANGTPH